MNRNPDEGRNDRRRGPVPLAFLAKLALAVAASVACGCRQADAADPRRDVQLIGLAPLYEALFAVANCPNVALDRSAYSRAARLYYLTATDLAVDGPFSREIAEFAAELRLRLEDDRVAFCDDRRLRFAVPQGILIDRGPERPGVLNFKAPF